MPEQRERLLAVVPARGGSKGVKRKNIADVCGKPLLAFTLEPALACVAAGRLTRLIVSTDDAEIAAVARACGAEAPFLRPPELATDTAKSSGLLLHALEEEAKRGAAYDTVMLLQPTSPLRSEADIAGALELWRRRPPGCESLISVYREDYVNDTVAYGRRGDIGVPKHPLHNRGVRRQEHEALYIRNGAFYITDAAYLRRTSLIVSDAPLLYDMPRSRSLNIDTEEDLAYLRWIVCT